MLILRLPEIDNDPARDIRLEHSLISLQNWEAEFEKPFFSKDEKTPEEFLAYFKFMLLDPMPYRFDARVSSENFLEVLHYINAKRSATFFREVGNQKPSREIVTSELIYYWMVNFNIPFEPSNSWHLNQLMNLIKICGIKQSKPKPMSKSAQMEQMRKLNAERRERLNTSG